MNVSKFLIPNPKEDSDNAVELTDVQGEIKFNNVSFSYNDKTEIRINLTIPKGKMALVDRPEEENHLL